jgi:GH43 family beta-xylosidase
MRLEHPQPGTGATYTNPVYARDFPDPFVLRFNGRYYAYATGHAEDGRRFPMLTSRDLLHWEPAGGAIKPLDLPGLKDYWAPEVAYSEGQFYLYYAVGNGDDPDHHLRLAVAEHPLGPWREAGVDLTPDEIFAIDAHPFRDPRDGQWYLYYARDVLEAPYAGTGLAVDRLPAMDRLEGKPRDVLRPHAEWHLFELQRAIKQNLDWYTIEGPFVRYVNGRYVCFYSGGRWENPSYGVAYAEADTPLGAWHDHRNAEGPLILRTVPEIVLGPGHNSVVVGPDLRAEYLVYHGWDRAGTARYPRIDRLRWQDGHPVCDGPSSEPRPAPRPADIAAWLDEGEPGPEWEARGDGWARTEEGLRSGGTSGLALREPQPDFVAEVSVKAGAGERERGVRVGDTEVALDGVRLRAGTESVALPSGFRHEAWHTLHLRRERGRLTVAVDEYPTVSAACGDGPAEVELFGGDGTRLAHFALTRLG